MHTFEHVYICVSWASKCEHMYVFHVPVRHWPSVPCAMCAMCTICMYYVRVYACAYLICACVPCVSCVLCLRVCHIIRAEPVVRVLKGVVVGKVAATTVCSFVASMCP